MKKKVDPMKKKEAAIRALKCALKDIEENKYDRVLVLCESDDRRKVYMGGAWDSPGEIICGLGMVTVQVARSEIEDVVVVDHSATATKG